MNVITLDIIKNYLLVNKLEFLPSHNKLSLPIINRIYKKMLKGIKFDDIKVNDNLIIDGHHRYISSKLSNFKINAVLYPKTSATVEYFWSEVQFVDEEWDTNFKITYLNQLDAKYNDLTLEKIIEILNKK